MSTADIGFSKVSDKIKSLGAVNVVEVKSGNKRHITFTALNGKQDEITTRAKKKGTWQTSINYGVSRSENPNETKFWVFVDISKNEPVFYVAPLWWVENDIYCVHAAYLERYNGKRANNDNSTHHSISRKRIDSWVNAWELMGLNA